MRSASCLLSVLAIATFSTAACGGGGDGGGGDDDDDIVEIDANTAPSIDASAQVTGDLGSPCTPDMEDPQGQGDCDAGFTCLALMGGTGAWCSKTCTGPQDASCATGYTGPGMAACYMGVDFDGPGGSAAVTYCGIVCGDEPGDPAICPSCDSTCPQSYLQCTGELRTQENGPVVARGCE